MGWAQSGEARTGTSAVNRGATHIVKLWEPNEYPQLAANEYYCLTAAGKCGLDVPPYRLAEDGMALVIYRFDLRMDGTYRGFEDFCALNARRTDEKYRVSYETQVMKRFAQFANSTHVNEDMEKLFILIALNCALRNGDAPAKIRGIWSASRKRFTRPQQKSTPIRKIIRSLPRPEDGCWRSGRTV